MNLAKLYRQEKDDKTKCFNFAAGALAQGEPHSDALFLSTHVSRMRDLLGDACRLPGRVLWNLPWPSYAGSCDRSTCLALGWSTQRFVFFPLQHASDLSRVCACVCTLCWFCWLQLARFEIMDEMCTCGYYADNGFEQVGVLLKTQKGRGGPHP